MQRRYRQKKYHCGEYLEVAIYPVYTKVKGRGKQCKPTSEIQKRLNQRHAEGRLRRLLNTNFTDADLFATLTFDDAHLPAAPEDAQKTPLERCPYTDSVSASLSGGYRHRPTNYFSLFPLFVSFSEKMQTYICRFRQKYCCGKKNAFLGKRWTFQESIKKWSKKLSHTNPYIP